MLLLLLLLLLLCVLYTALEDNMDDVTIIQTTDMTTDMVTTISDMDPIGNLTGLSCYYAVLKYYPHWNMTVIYCRCLNKCGKEIKIPDPPTYLELISRTDNIIAITLYAIIMAVGTVGKFVFLHTTVEPCTNLICESQKLA